MPSFDILVDGKPYHIEIPDPAVSPLEVIVDGQSFLVNLSGGPVPAAVPAQAASAPAPTPAPAPAVLPIPAAVAIRRPVAPAGADGGHDITAPMPGVILSLDVRVGQPVEAGQVVCVLEAMKMKNPIRASQSGIVAQTAAQAGQSVAYGDLLVRLA